MPADLSQVEALASRILIAEENGLFRFEKAKALRDKIQSAIEEALAADTQAKADGCQSKLNKLFEEAWGGSPPYWRILYRYGFLHLFLAALGAFAMAWAIRAWSTSLSGIIGVPEKFFWIGYLGAILKAFFWTLFQATRGQLLKSMALPQMVAPLIGVLLSIPIFYLFKAGVIVFGGETQNIEINENVMGLVVFFSGFNWNWALELLQKFADRIKLGFK